MSRALITLRSKADFNRALRWISQAPAGTRLEFKAPRRSLPQNDRLWAMLTDVATQLRWHGQKLTPEDWKAVFVASLKRELRIVPNLDGNGFVHLGHSSSELSKEEFGNLLDLIDAFGANHGVVFHDPSSDNPPASRSEGLEMVGAGVPTGHRGIGSASFEAA